MAGLLISGPAGAGKSEIARAEVASRPQSIMIDFQTIYAGLLGIERLPNGRYPERLESDAYAMPLSEYVRRAAITGALARELEPIVTNSDGSPERRAFLLGLMPGATERVIDPGIDVVTARLTNAEGVLSEQCRQAIQRWHGRLGTL